MSTRSARVPAYAKLNLGLRVLYKRADGYHELRTVFQTISLADSIDISFAPGRGTQIRVDGTPEIADNLVERAARRLADELSIRGNISFNLKKRIPTGAGLGGGSSDAAAVLLSLPALTRKTIASDRLQAIAAELGSDVPFFLHGGTALGLGRGEELYPLPDTPATRGLLVLPRIHSSTVEAYRALSDRLASAPSESKMIAFQADVWRGVAGANDFEEVVFEQHPQLREMKQRLIQLGASPAAMTGSGSAIFGIFSDPRKLQRAAKQFPEAGVVPIRFVSRGRYQAAFERALRTG